MLGLGIELTRVGALFLWLYRRHRASRIRPAQLHLDFDGET